MIPLLKFTALGLAAAVAVTVPDVATYFLAAIVAVGVIVGPNGPEEGKRP